MARKNPLPANTSPILRPGPSAVTYHIPTTPSSSKTTICLPANSTWTSGLHFHTRHTEYLRLLKGSIFVDIDGETKIYTASAADADRAAQLTLEIPRYARHNWGRADVYLKNNQSSDCSYDQLVQQRQQHRSDMAKDEKNEDGDVNEEEEEEVIVEEWTSPNDISKPLFFWNLNGVIIPPSSHPSQQKPNANAAQNILKQLLGNWWIPFQLFIIFWDLDNWPVFISLGRGRGRGGRRGLLEWVEYGMTFLVLFVAKVVGWVVGVRAVEKGRTPDELWREYVKGNKVV